MVERTNTHFESSERSSSTGLALLVGGLTVAVAVIAFVLFSGADEPSSDVSVTVEGAGAAVEDAATALEAGAEDAAAAVESAAGDAASAVEGAAAATEDAVTGN